MSKRTNMEDVYPLSPTQEGMLFHTLSDQGGGVYVGQFGFRLAAELDVGAFRRAWQGVVDRHPPLRTGFAWEKVDRPLQVVAREAPLPFRSEDWRGASREEQEARLEAFLRGDREEGFDLGKAPLMRLALFRLEDAAYRMVWTHHHMVLDGWSLGLVYRDVLALYEAYAEGREARLPRPRPYRDYVAWLKGRDLAAAERFWRGALAGIAAPTPLGIGRGVEAAPGGRAETGRSALRLPPGAAVGVAELARRGRMTPGTVVQGAWALLLSRYSGEDDVVFGTAVSGRPAELEGVEEMVGLFVATLPVRARVAPETPVLEWLEGLHRRQGEAREHEHAPLVQVQGWSEVPRGTPLFESCLSFQNYPVDPASPTRDRFGVEDVWGLEVDDYPLVVAATPSGDDMVLECTWHCGRFRADEAERLLAHLRNVLEAFVAAPERPLREVSILAPGERERLVAAGKGTAADFPWDALVHDVIAERAARWPDVPAAMGAGRSLTYRELHAQADRLAGALRARGAGPEARVALLLDRGVELAVGLLGTLRAGAAYVPLDPGYPADRLRFLLEDSGARVVVTRSSLVGSLPEEAGEALCVDRLPEDAGPPERTAGRAGPDNLAYAIYTSGSTGRPKGVMVTHRSLLCYAEAMRERLSLTPADRFLQFASPSFDVMVEEIFPAWLAGAAVVFPGADLLGSPADLAGVLEAYGVTALELPTAFWHEWAWLLEEEGAGLPPSVRFVIVGGERILADRLRAWAGIRVPLVHVFGLTETTVSSTTLRLEAGEDGSTHPNLPVGHPLPNVELRVLDAAGEPAPDGVPGELSVGGEGVARGYLGRPALTAERFVPDPFGGVPGARLYRTGDRVRRLYDGSLEFLGRIDAQVKVRGFRIEPAEVEAALATHPAVLQAAVVVREDAPGDRRLVGYVVPVSGHPAPSVPELREHLERSLPAYMVPSAFVALEGLPLTANGKTDHRALPVPPEDRVRSTAFEVPRDGVEETLARIWGELLRVERVGIHDSYFELGGDSILAIQIVSRARRAGLHLRPRQLFQDPTVARLAARVAAAPAPPARPDPGSLTGEAPLLPVQRWFFAQEVPERHHWNLPLLLELRRPVDPALLREALGAVALHHDALRFRYARTAGGEWMQRYAPPAEAAVPLDREDLAHVPDRELADEIERRCSAAQERLDPESGPVLRALLLEPGNGRPARLLLAAHHLVMDGVSWRIVVEDLQAAYEAMERGGRPVLPPRTTSFREWAERLAEHAARGGFDAELDFWRDGPRWMPRPLPVDEPGPNSAGAVRTVSVSLDADGTHALLREVPAAYRSRPDDALLAALVRAFEGWTGDPHLRVELEGHGREELFPEVDLSRTVGWLTSVHPVLLDVRGAAHAGEALKRVKEQLRAVPSRGIGFGALRWLGRDAAHERLAELPAAEVSFNYLGRIDAPAPAGALFALAAESPGADLSPRAPRAHLLEVNAAVQGGELRVEWRYGSLVHRRETVQALAERYLAELRALAAICREEGAGGCTPSDFPLAGLDQAGIDALLGSGRDVEDVYPLAPTQEGIHFETLYTPQAGVYVAQYRFALAGELDEEAFLHAWRRVLERHPALRVGFVSGVADRPLQVVRRGAELPVLHEDRRGLPEAERERRMEAFLAEDRARGFDPARPPLMRLALFHDADAERTLVWTFHQGLLDGWSLPVVFREVLAAYDAFSRGREPALPDAPPYREYVAWLRRQEPARAEGFWRGALAGLAAPTPLGVDRPAGTAGAGGYGRVETSLPPALCDALLAAARRGELTVNTLVQGAWALLLSRYSGEEDVLFGTAVSGRPAELEGVEEMVGVFIATLPVRARVAPDAPVLPWLRALQELQAEAREHGHVPLAAIQRWSGVPAGTPFFESVLAYENYPVDGVLAGERPLRIGTLAQHEQSNYPLAVAVFPGTPLRVLTTFDRARFGADAVERMMGHLRVVLEGIARGGEHPLGSVALLDGAERRALLAMERAAVPAAAARCVHELFAEQAERTPDAIALAQGERTLTYAELDRSANRLANHLRGRGVGPDVRVGVCVERSPEMVVAILGVLKAGGAYLPLDPEYPAERLALMLVDAAAPVLVTRERLLERVAAPGTEAVCVDRDAPAIDGEPDTAPAAGATPEHLCYVIYTSGSTGLPKGTEVPHRAVPGFFRGVDYARFDAEQVLLQHSAVSWDALTLELWPALLTGGRCVLYTGAPAEPAALGAEVRSHGVTTLWLSAAFFNLVVDSAPEALAGVSQVMTGGEAVSLPHVRRALELYPGMRVVNGYGPSECTVFASCHVVPPGADGPGVPIGVPVGDRRVHVLGRSLEPVPTGVPGEAYVGGLAVARGYLGRPELTAEKFVPDPFGEAGARLYRTGDRVRRGADGLLEFVGRMDGQVKVRGFRVEPGEVEAALLRHPGVREAVVIVREDAPGDRRLVAYLTAVEGAAAPGAAELREHLAGSLPRHLVPSAFVLLEAIPLTPHGKTDRRALPAPEAVPSSADGEYLAPRGEAEQALAAVWARVLRLERVGASDNFFEVGGDSILSIQVVTEARRAGLEITPRQVFEHPTVAALARVAGRAGAVRAEQGPVAGEAPLTPIQHWFFEQEDPHPDHSNQALLLAPREPLRLPVLEGALAALVRHHDALRLRFRRQGEGWSQSHAPVEDTVPVGSVDLARVPEAGRAGELDRRATELHASLDLAAGPLLRAALFELDRGEQRLLLVVHHLAVDAVSWRVLLEDLEAACRRLADGLPPQLPPKTTSFRDWSHRLSAHARTAAAGAELEHWTDPGRRVRPLPVDHPGGENTVATARVVAVSLGEEETEALLREVPAAYRTQINDVLLAALADTMAGWTGERRLLVSVEGHGREDLFPDVDLSRTVGWFTAAHPVLLDVGEGGGPGERLKRVKEQLREVPGKGVGYGLLRYLHPDEAVRGALRELPGPQVSFNYLGQFDQSFSDGALFRLVDEPSGSARGPRGLRHHLLELDARIEGGRLRVEWSYSAALHRPATVQRLAGRYLERLRELISHCREEEPGGYTASDFALAGIDADTLAILESEIMEEELDLYEAGA